jgi:soluble lytic murein transglycosylase-like protein
MRTPVHFPAFLATPALVCALAVLPLHSSSREDYFTPKHRLSAIGASRPELDAVTLTARTARMIDAETFTILRDPHALEGVRRITSPRLQKIFQQASAQSGFPASTLAAIAYLESFGDPLAESPAGPKGIMQFSEATARSAGLSILRATRYRITTEKTLVKRKGKKPLVKVVQHKTPYTVLLRDDRLIPEKAIPAAASYLSRMTSRFGGRDWAVFAYHCGEGCVSYFLNLRDQLTNSAHPLNSYPSVFFSGSPVWRRELYDLVQEHMLRDWSPTYYFRVMRAEQLVTLFQQDPDEFEVLFTAYRNQDKPEQRAGHRLLVWLRSEDFFVQSANDLRVSRRNLVRLMDDPAYYGFEIDKSIGSDDREHQPYFWQASPSAAGTLLYIAYETRRLFDLDKPKHEKFVPLEVTDLVYPADYRGRLLGSAGESAADFNAHCTGQVFDISLARLGPRERECLRFVLDEMGWDGYLGFSQETPSADMLHIGCSPSSRDFFTQVYEDAVGERQPVS